MLIASLRDQCAAWYSRPDSHAISQRSDFKETAQFYNTFPEHRHSQDRTAMRRVDRRDLSGSVPRKFDKDIRFRSADFDVDVA